MAHIHARHGQDRKRNGGNFKPQGKHGQGNGSGGNRQGAAKNKYAEFSRADARQRELAAHDGSLLGSMPLLEEQRRREEDARTGWRRYR